MGSLPEIMQKDESYCHPDFETFKTNKRIRAMGSELGGTLAIVTIDRFEQVRISHQILCPLAVYLRYLDDSGTAVDTKRARPALQTLEKKHLTT